MKEIQAICFLQIASSNCIRKSYRCLQWTNEKITLYPHSFKPHCLDQPAN